MVAGALERRDEVSQEGLKSGDVVFGGGQLHGVSDAKIELRRYDQELAGG
jgi:hypothetical protein